MIQPRITGGFVQLRLADPSDLENLVRWLNDPSIYQWWGGHPVSSEEIERKYTGQRSPEVTSYIIEESGTPVGYAQSWQTNESSCGIDIFLDSAKQGQGLGTDAVRALTKYLITIEGRRVVTADPSPDNVRALVMFQSVGFVPSGRATEEGNPELVFQPQEEMV